MRRVVWALLVAYAYAVPWAYTLEVGEVLGNVARIVGLLALAAAIPAILFNGRLRTPVALHWLMLALFVWLCCTSFWTLDQHATLARLRACLQVMLPAWLVWEFIETPPDLRDVLRACVGGTWVLAALTLANFASADLATQIRFAAEGQDPNDVARLLDLGFPLAALLIVGEAKWPWKLMAASYIPVGLTGVLLTASRGGFLAAIVALAGCAFLLFRRHTFTVLAAAISVPTVAVTFWFLVPPETIQRIATLPEQLQRGDLNQRLNIWAAGWNAFIHAPFFGSGAGTFVYAARLAPIDTAHNTALTIAVESGVVGLFLAAAILAACARSVLALRGAVRIALGTAFLVWLVASLAATVDSNRTTWLLLGLFAIASRLTAQEPELLEHCFSAGVAKAPAVLAGDSV